MSNVLDVLDEAVAQWQEEVDRLGARERELAASIEEILSDGLSPATARARPAKVVAPEPEERKVERPQAQVVPAEIASLEPEERKVEKPQAQVVPTEATAPGPEERKVEKPQAQVVPTEVAAPEPPPEPEGPEVEKPQAQVVPTEVAAPEPEEDEFASLFSADGEDELDLTLPDALAGEDDPWADLVAAEKERAAAAPLP